MTKEVRTPKNLAQYIKKRLNLKNENSTFSVSDAANLIAIYDVISSKSGQNISAQKFFLPITKKYKTHLETLQKFGLIERCGDYEPGNHSFTYRVKNKLTKTVSVNECFASNDELINLLSTKSIIDDSDVSTSIHSTDENEIAIANYETECLKSVSFNHGTAHLKALLQLCSSDKRKFVNKEKLQREFNISNGMLKECQRKAGIAKLHDIDETVEMFVDTMKKCASGDIEAVAYEYGRSHHQLQQCNSVLRKLVLIDGEKTAEIDITAMHPTIMQAICLQNCQSDYAHYMSIFADGDVYSKIASMSGLTRSETKLQMLTALNEKTGRWNKFAYWKILKRECPKFYSFLKSECEKDDKFLTVQLMKFEGSLMNAIKFELMQNQIKFFGVHDSVTVQVKNLNSAIEIVKNNLSKFNLKTTFKFSKSSNSISKTTKIVKSISKSANQTTIKQTIQTTTTTLYDFPFNSENSLKNNIFDDDFDFLLSEIEKLC